MVITTEKIDVLVYNGGAGSRCGGNGITHIERTDSSDEADIWKVVENPNDYSMFVVHVGNHF